LSLYVKFQVFLNYTTAQWI